MREKNESRNVLKAGTEALRAAAAESEKFLRNPAELLRVLRDLAERGVRVAQSWKELPQKLGESFAEELRSIRGKPDETNRTRRLLLRISTAGTDLYNQRFGVSRDWNGTYGPDGALRKPSPEEQEFLDRNPELGPIMNAYVAGDFATRAAAGKADRLEAYGHYRSLLDDAEQLTEKSV